MSGIQLENIVFTYENGFVAVDDVSFTIHENEKVAIIGQNGAGKTTTVKLMNGLLRPSSGKVYVDGKDISELTTAQASQMVGYVFQNPGDQIFNKTVYDEIAYTLRYFKKSKEEVDRIVHEAANMCHVEEYLEINPYDLPFSLRKFVTIATVVAIGTKYIILDEPTAGQDLLGLQYQKEIIDELIQMGRTVIIITHDMDFVVDNFDRVLVMAKKKLVGDKGTKDIFWNQEILDKAALKQPTVAHIAKDLGFKDKVININEFIEYVQR